MTSAVSIEVSYGQLAVFWRGLERPFSDWSDDHVAQGFAWRAKSVSFRTLVETGRHDITVSISNGPPSLSPRVKRVLRVPFDVPPSGEIEVASISDGAAVALPPGTYQLQCEFLGAIEHQSELVHLTFFRSTTPIFEVAVADAELSPPTKLLTTANPAD